MRFKGLLLAAAMQVTFFAAPARAGEFTMTESAARPPDESLWWGRHTSEGKKAFQGGVGCKQGQSITVSRDQKIKGQYAALFDAPCVNLLTLADFVTSLDSRSFIYPTGEVSDMSGMPRLRPALVTSPAELRRYAAYSADTTIPALVETLAATHIPEPSGLVLGMSGLIVAAASRARERMQMRS